LNLLNRLGCHHFFVCPGSRDAPIIHALGQMNKAEMYSQLDERCAGYHALGLAKHLGKPVAVVCTSGTAALNLSPAMAEAFYQNVSIIAITADRPLDALNTFENQTINQSGIFANYVGAELHIELDRKLSQQLKNGLGTKIQEAVFNNKPIHLNIHLSEPLYHFEESGSTNKDMLFSIGPQNELEGGAKEIPEAILTRLRNAKRALIVLGFSAQKEAFQNHGQIVIADVCSANYRNGNIAFADFFIEQMSVHEKEDLMPDVLITSGTYLLSKRLRNWLKKSKPAYHLHIGRAPELKSSYSKDFDVLDWSMSNVLAHLKTNKDYSNKWFALEKKYETIVQNRRSAMKSTFMETLFYLLNQVDQSLLHCGNSMSVRYAALFQSLRRKFDSIICNRGTSGIDGCVSTFLGYGCNTDYRQWLLVGDLSFFYDSNAFWLSALPKKFVIMVINNHLGQIFNVIDGPDQLKDGQSFITSPHPHSVQQIAQMHRITYFKVENLADAKQLNLNASEKVIIEIFDDNPETPEHYKTIYA
jgi:2-succinyl-5-enolpyruvyl-6-hydroxy-3-cyclohexene-1-carboxylate synthase